MRPSPRLSFLAAACTVAMIVSSAVALDYPYDMSVTGGSAKEGASPVAGWLFSSIGNSGGHANFNARDDAMVLTNSFSMPITNIIVYYKASAADANRILILDGHNETTGNGPGSRDFPVSTSQNTRIDFDFAPSDAVDHIEIALSGGTGSKGTWILYSVTIQTVDPPPTITIQSPPQEAGTASDLVVHFAATSFEGDAPLTFSATATNLTSGVTITDQSYFHFDHNYSMMHPDYYDFTFHTPEGFEPCEMRFTITATGRGGSASQSFDCTFTEGVVPTPPQIYSPWLNPPFVLAGRTISGRVGCEEAVGDVVTFSFVSGTSQQGTFTIDPSSGDFSFTPTRQDVGDSPEVHVFTVRATDKDDSRDANITIVALPVSQPQLTHIKPQTVLCGDTLQVALVVEDTEYDSYDPEYIDDPLISSNITIKAGTTAPEGEYVFEDGCLSFTPTTNDIGQTFIFTASATDLDGTTNQDFNVTVGLAAPVLKHCPVDDWTATSFTADIEEAVPGATSYNLRRINSLSDGTKATQTVNNVTFPYTFTDLPSTNQHYWAQAVRGNTVSAWSDKQTVSLQNWLPFVPAMKMTGAAHGSYTQDFDTLGNVNNKEYYWYDGRTLSGWYASHGSASMTDAKYTALNAMGTSQGAYSVCSDENDNGNRGFVFRNTSNNDAGKYRLGVVFTNCCRYAVTNITVSYIGLQHRRLNSKTSFKFEYFKSAGAIESCAPSTGYNHIGTLDYETKETGGGEQYAPPLKTKVSGVISLTGDNALLPGESIILRWQVEGTSQNPCIGIDDVTISWRCAWPCHTVIMLQ